MALEREGFRAKLPEGGTYTVDDAWSQHGTIAKASSLIEDLRSKFASGANDQNQCYDCGQQLLDLSR